MGEAARAMSLDLPAEAVENPPDRSRVKEAHRRTEYSIGHAVM